MRRKVVQRKHISDDEIIEAWLECQCVAGPQVPLVELIWQAAGFFNGTLTPPQREVRWIYDYLPQYPVKVVLAKMEQMVDRGLMDFGVSLRTAWVNEDALVRHLTRSAC